VGSRYSYTWWTVWTAISGEGITVQISNESASNTTGIDLATVMAIKLSDDLVEDITTPGGDWSFVQTSTATTLAATESTANNASITFTPTATGDVLVLSRARFTLTGAGSTVEYITRLTRTGQATSSDPEVRRQVEDVTNESPVLTNMRVFSVTNGSANTFAEKSLAQVATGGSRSHSAIFVLKLDKIRNSAFSTYSTAGISINNTTNYAVTVATTSLTPAVQGNVVVLGSFTFRSNTLTATCKGRIQVDNTTEAPINQTSKAYTRGDPQTATEKVPIQNIGIFTPLSTAAHTIDMDGSVSATGTTRLAEQTQLVALTMELVLQPQVLVRVINEEIELPEQDPDEARFLSLVDVADTESVQISEPVHPLIRIRNLSPVPSDFQSGDFLVDDFLVVTPSGPEIEGPVTISENITTKILAPGVRVVDAEPVHITEAGYHIISKLREINESIEISETIGALLNLTREGSPLDSVSVSEIVTLVQDLARILDTEGIDISEVINHIKYITKVVGHLPATSADFLAADFIPGDFVTAVIPGAEHTNIAEAVNKTLSLLRVIGVGEPGFTDEGFIETGFTSRPAETINISESVPLNILGKAKVINESLELLEEVSQVGGVIPQIIRVIDESVEITDLLNRLTNQVRAIDESLSVEEAQNLVLNLIRIHTEQIEIAETLSQNKVLTRVIDESAEILEAASRNLSLTRVVNETQELTDSITAAMNKIRIVDEQTDISDHIVHILTEPGIIKKVVPAEGVDISETIEKVQGLVRAIEESVNLEETVPYIRELVKVINETIELSDTQVSVKGKAQVITEAVEAAEDLLTKLEVSVTPPTPTPTPTPSVHVPLYHKRRYRLEKQRVQYLYPIEPERKKPKEEEIEEVEEKLPRVRVTLTIRYDRAAAKEYINIDQLVARSLIASLSHQYKPQAEPSDKTSYPEKPMITIKPNTRQSHSKSNDVILLKDTVKASLTPVYNQAVTVLSTDLKIPYNLTQTVTKDSIKVTYDRLQTVSTSLTALYDKSVSVGKTLGASYNMQSGPNYRKLQRIGKRVMIARANMMLLSMMDDPVGGEEE
jgi:hypothetical protein